MSAVRGRGKFQLMPTRYVGLAARGRSAESPRERENRLCRSFDFAEIACGNGTVYAVTLHQAYHRIEGCLENHKHTQHARRHAHNARKCDTNITTFSPVASSEITRRPKMGRVVDVQGELGLLAPAHRQPPQRREHPPADTLRARMSVQQRVCGDCAA